MRVVVPISVSDPKTRLAPVLTLEERREFIQAMLTDVLDTLTTAGYDPEVISTAPLQCAAPVTVDDRPLDTLLNDLLTMTVNSNVEALAVLMADLPLIDTTCVTRLFGSDSDVVFAPGLGGGTNAFVCRHPDFGVDFHGASIRDHRETARGIGAKIDEIDSRRLAIDIDEPPDLAEVLLHSDGAAADWLTDAGFELSIEHGRVAVHRE